MDNTDQTRHSADCLVYSGRGCTCGAALPAAPCTEPDRASCPRRCMDFCNAAELAAPTVGAGELALSSGNVFRDLNVPNPDSTKDYADACIALDLIPSEEAAGQLTERVAALLAEVAAKDAQLAEYRGWYATQGDCLGKSIDNAEALLKRAELAEANLAGMGADKARMDWLERQHVEVRTPLRYGSRSNFHSSPDADSPFEDEASDLRAAIDAALSRAQGTETT